MNYIYMMEGYNLILEFILRMALSLILGFSIGLERELTNKVAGLRTHTLVCLGSTLFTLLSIYSFNSVGGDSLMKISHDPARISAQILTGVGFIGGGAVLKHGTSVRGITTASTLWISSAIGMAVGSGEYWLSVVSTVMTLILLVGARRLEQDILKNHVNKLARLNVSIDLINSEFVISELQNNDFKVIEIIRDSGKMDIVLEVYGKDPIKTVKVVLNSISNISNFSIKIISEE